MSKVRAFTAGALFLATIAVAGCATEQPEAPEARKSTTSKMLGDCPNGDGYYCGGDGVYGYTDTLYYCSGGVASYYDTCANGCVQTAAGEADYCAGASGGSATGQQIVETARAYLNTPYDYSWENCIPYTSMNCSCLTATVMNQYGWSLTADDVAQSYYGTYVDYNDLQPGDLVFFDEEGTGISHVGIYSGGGYLVHSSAYFGYVVESDMSYIYGYYTARRLY